MTEPEWRACSVPSRMIDHLLDKGVSRRKWRLLACACCRRFWHVLADDRSRPAVEVAEAYADGLATHDRLFRARIEAREASREGYRRSPGDGRAWRAATAARDATRDTGVSAARNALAETARAASDRDFNDFDEQEMRVQADLLRCVVGDPFRRVVFRPDWRTPEAVSLAESMYEGRTFDRMTNLADALLVAGCDDEHILGHCRSPGPHARGCWVVDLVLERS